MTDKLQLVTELTVESEHVVVEASRPPLPPVCDHVIVSPSMEPA